MSRFAADPSVSHHFDLYVSTSKDMRSVLAEYDPNLAMASLDEGYLKYVRSLRTSLLAVSPHTWKGLECRPAKSSRS
jgi:nucleotidyltransferase/DNA polymerase involved in DNA repair